MKRILEQSFYERPALVVAPELLGKTLVRRHEGIEKRLTISEVEAYLGEEDLASHARFGKTSRNQVMYGPAGHIYMYLIYGIHWMLNIVVDQENQPAAILIRGTLEVSGPGRLSKALQLDKTFNERILNVSSGLWIEDAPKLPSSQIIQTPRIGIDYAGDWVQKPFRFVSP